MPSQLVTNSMTLNDLELFRNSNRHLSTFTTQRRAVLYAVYGTSCRKLVETFGMYLCIHVVGIGMLFLLFLFFIVLYRLLMRVVMFMKATSKLVFSYAIMFY